MDKFTDAEIKRMYELHKIKNKTIAEIDESEKFRDMAVRRDRVRQKERKQEEEKEE